MRIYVAHSKKMDYINQLYLPLKQCEVLKKHELIFPHEYAKDNYHTRDFYRDIDLFMAEVSFPATGLGIELGFAYDERIPVYCFYKKGSKVSSSIHFITDQILEYQDVQELITILCKVVVAEEEKVYLGKGDKNF